MSLPPQLFQLADQKLFLIVFDNECPCFMLRWYAHCCSKNGEGWDREAYKFRCIFSIRVRLFYKLFNFAELQISNRGNEDESNATKKGLWFTENVF